MEWLLIAALTCVVVLIMPLIALYARRRYLTGQGGLFDCAYQFRGLQGRRQWALGFGRYRADQLEWFRAFSLSLNPAVMIQRGRSDYIEQREPSSDDAQVLFERSRIVVVRSRENAETHILAMQPQNATGLMSWLESAPPGSHVIPGSADSPL